MLEVYSIRRDLSNDVLSTRWYCLYRTKPGMWESLFIIAESADAARTRLEEMYAEGWIK